MKHEQSGSAAGRIGLYYPFIHFRDDSWVKLAALYWGKIARIVPPGYPTRDSEVVRELHAGLDLVLDKPPGPASSAVGRDFAEVVAAHSDRLRVLFKVDTYSKGVWGAPEPRPAAGSPQENDVAWIHVSKLSDELREALIAAELAIDGRHAPEAHDWIGVHPAVAEVYMTALADVIAISSGFEPVTEDPVHHLGASGWSVERLAMALLEKPEFVVASEEAESRNGHEATLAFLALETVVPKDLDAVPASRIVEVRKEYGAELTAFHDEIASLANAEHFKDVRDPEALRHHVQLIYGERIKPQLERLKRDLKLLKLDTTLGALDMKVAAPGVLVGSAGMAGAQLSEAVAASSGVAVGLASLVLAHRREAQQRVRSSPAAYLLRVEEGLTPRSLSQTVQQNLRRFVTGV